MTTKETRPYVRLTCCWVGDEQIALCPLHAAAPEMLAMLRKLLSAGIFHGPAAKYERDARALLDTIDPR